MPSFLSGYSLRKAITIDNTFVDSDLTNFPLLVKIAADSDIGANIDATGLNIRFTGSDGTTTLNYERQSFSVSGGAATGIFWVQVPTVFGAVDTTIYIYYKSASPSDGQNVSATWDANYISVWHMEQDPSGTDPQELDSATTANHLTAGGSMGSGQLASAKILNGITFDGSNDRLSKASVFNFERTDTFTLECIFQQASSTPANLMCMFGKQLQSGSFNGWYFGIDGSKGTGAGSTIDPFALLLRNSLGNNLQAIWANDADDTAFHTAACTYDGSSSTSGVKGYVDGVSKTIVSFSNSLSATITSTASFAVGASDSTGNSSFNGTLDECRVSNIVRSAAWLKFVHNNIFQADNEISFGLEESASGGTFFGRGVISGGAMRAGKGHGIKTGGII